MSLTRKRVAHRNGKSFRLSDAMGCKKITTFFFLLSSNIFQTLTWPDFFIWSVAEKSRMPVAPSEFSTDADNVNEESFCHKNMILVMAFLRSDTSKITTDLLSKLTSSKKQSPQLLIFYFDRTTIYSGYDFRFCTIPQLQNAFCERLTHVHILGYVTYV